MSKAPRKMPPEMLENFLRSIENVVPISEFGIREHIAALSLELREAREGAGRSWTPLKLEEMKCAGCNGAFTAHAGSIGAVFSNGEWFHTTSCIGLRDIRSTPPGQKQ